MELQEIRLLPLNIVILAAGLGTRMRSGLAKVLHTAGGLPLIAYVCRTAAALDPEKIYVVVGHQEDDVRRAVLNELDEQKVVFIKQAEQKGTGDAVACVKEHLADSESNVLVLSGDVPLIRPETLATLITNHRNHRGRGASCTILTVKLKDPTGYGRIVRDKEGRFEKIVEERDTTDEQRQIEEVNAGVYCFFSKSLFKALGELGNNNSQKEFYLTDVPEILRNAGEDVAIVQHNDPQEVEGVNNRLQLADIERLLRRNTVRKLMLDYGVTFLDPKAAYISQDSKFGRDVTIYPNVIIEGKSEIGDGSSIGQGVRISNSRIGRSVKILDHCVITDAEVEDNCTVGPFAHLRGGAKTKENAKVGNFVELKNTILGEGAKANHLAYLGDAEIGENTNIGAGTITCNFDGKRKHKTRIGKNVKIGSDTMLVAPVEVGDEAATGAGSVVTKDVPPQTLVVGVPAKKVRKIENDR
jgi:bifunctional UDP-N-acetylglucosamine pyrophosphorylase/glucosamine-1-phosphate N-acetyltransferase